MALIIVSGLPCSGRSRRVHELRTAFEGRIASAAAAPSSSSGSSTLRRVVALTDDDISNTRAAYDTQAAEKPARAAYLSLVVRRLAPDTLVLADGGAGTNIKGFRYQLWCAAREAGVRCVSVLVAAPPGECARRNERRRLRGEPAYAHETLSELLLRFEEPGSTVRWDSPLFVLPSGGDDEGMTDAETCLSGESGSSKLQATPAGGEPQGAGAASPTASACGALQAWEPAPLDAIWEAVSSGKTAKAPSVVAPLRSTTTNYLSLLESSTQAVLSAYAAALSSSAVPSLGGAVTLSVSGDALALNLPPGRAPPTLAALQRLRRSFVRLHSTGASALSAIGEMVEQEASGARHAGGGGGEAAVARRFVQYIEETLAR